jgi:hypothetical protein
MEQMAKLQQCQMKFAECENKLYCSECMGICKGGTCTGNKFAVGPYGLRGPGRGRGNQIGELPDVEASFDPKMLPGDMTKGKILASIMQRAAPTDGAESTIEYSEQALVQVKQQAEEALTREEIPPGSREFVRQYFGSLEPESTTEQSAPPVPGFGAAHRVALVAPGVLGNGRRECRRRMRPTQIPGKQRVAGMGRIRRSGRRVSATAGHRCN